MKKLILILAVILLLLTPAFLKSKASYESPYEHPPLQTLYEVELTNWVERLAKCESNNNEKAINVSDGGSRSVGYVQYKDDTWYRYNNKFKLSYKAEDIWSREAQIEVTKAVITNDYAYGNWFNCTKKIGLPPKP